MPRQSGMADREPCPWRIVDDVGGAFCMGNIGKRQPNVMSEIETHAGTGQEEDPTYCRLVEWSHVTVI